MIFYKLESDQHSHTLKRIFTNIDATKQLINLLILVKIDIYFLHFHKSAYELKNIIISIS